MRIFKLTGLAVLFAALVVPFGGALAQQEDVEEIVVTGSRLKANPNLAAAVPVMSVTGSQGMERGNVRVEEFINVLPQVMAGQASEVSNGATGTATLNLRGLGTNRTLVLMDGRRLPYGASSVSAPNLDIIPLALVERIDILTGGASAVYGSDAVGGVANFILKSDFEGVELGVQYGAAYSANDRNFWTGVLEAGDQPVPGSVWDGQEVLIYSILGGNLDDGRGNVTVFASYEDRNEINQANRMVSGCALGQNSGPQSFGGFGCIGSSNYRAFAGGTSNPLPPIGTHFQLDDGTMIPFAGGPSQTYNFGPLNYFQRPGERWSIYAKGTYEIFDNLQAFLDISYTDNVSDAQIAETASFGSNYSINCDNPFLQGNPGVPFTDIFGCDAAAIAAGTISNGNRMSHRNVEGGPRNSRNENTALRFAAGLSGSFAEDVWSWDAFVQLSETRDQGISTNDFVVANLQQALFAVDDGTGNVVCTVQTGGCVPYNIFQRTPAGESLVTREMTDWLHGIGIVNGETSQTNYGATIQGDLGNYGIQVPTAEYGVSALFGYEYRKDYLRSRPDEISQIPGGGFTGVGGATLAVEGESEVNELFTEIEVPLVAGMTAIEELTFRGQFRTSMYDTKGNQTTNSYDVDAYGVSLAWAPIQQLRLRTQFQRSVRAPNVIEMYTGQNTDLPDLEPAGVNSLGVQLFDPCVSTAPLRTLEECQRTGMTAAQYGSGLVDDVISGQTQSITGGNPFLLPEEADTVTFGFVWTPTFVQGLTLSVDYFDITIEDAIEPGVEAQIILDTCLDTGDPTFCDLIIRSPSGSLASGFGPEFGFINTNLNIGEIATEGFDIQAAYSFDSGSHGHNFDYAATVIDQLDTIPFPGASPEKCAGKFSTQCKPPSPEYRHRLIYTWQTPWDIDVTATWRHFGSVDHQNPNETLETGLDSKDYIDLSAEWLLMDDSISIRVSMLNIFEEESPVATFAGTGVGNGNTYPTMYDTSSYYYAGFRLNY